MQPVWAIDYVVGVDRGAHYCFDQQVQPDCMVGDFDSCEPSSRDHFRATGVTECVHPVDKNHSDLELALQLIADKGYTEVLVACGLGGRVDHMLFNLLLCKQARRSGVAMVQVDDQQSVLLLQKESGMRFHSATPVSFSLVPIDDSRISIQGACWPLKDQHVARGSSLTLSNECLAGSTVEIEIHSGEALCVVQSSEANIVNNFFAAMSTA
jgi:thiamine pyrophosphokinase